MTRIFVYDSPSNMEALHDCIFELTGKEAKNHTSIFPMNNLILIDVRAEGVYLIHGRAIEEDIDTVSLSEALLYIREQVFIQSLEK